MCFEDVSRFFIILRRRHDLENDLYEIDGPRVDPIAVTDLARIDGMDDSGVRK